MTIKHSPYRVALVHDFLREYGGAERVLEELHRIFPEAPVYTAFVDPKALSGQWHRFADWTIIESSARKIPGIHQWFSPLRIFAAYFFEEFDFSSYDLVISSSNMYMAKAVITAPTTLHLAYIHTPPRSLYGYTTQTNWRRNPITRFFGEILNVLLRQVDYLTAQRPDVLLTNSQETRRRIQKYYRRDAIVVHPPVSLVTALKAHKREYFLFVGRLAYAKHPELAVRICTDLGVPLHVVGTGGMFKELQSIAGNTVTFLGSVDDSTLAKEYSGAKALLFPVEDEDFGIVPVEAMCAGTPVIAHRSGGPKETILSGETGIFIDSFDEQEWKVVLKKWDSYAFNHDHIVNHAASFSPTHFRSRMLSIIQEHQRSAQSLNTDQKDTHAPQERTI